MHAPYGGRGSSSTGAANRCGSRREMDWLCGTQTGAGVPGGSGSVVWLVLLSYAA
jgi:hypothetical protein